MPGNSLPRSMSTNFLFFPWGWVKSLRKDSIPLLCEDLRGLGGLSLGRCVPVEHTALLSWGSAVCPCSSPWLAAFWECNLGSPVHGLHWEITDTSSVLSSPPLLSPSPLLPPLLHHARETFPNLKQKFFSLLRCVSHTFLLTRSFLHSSKDLSFWRLKPWRLSPLSPSGFQNWNISPQWQQTEDSSCLNVADEVNYCWVFVLKN